MFVAVKYLEDEQALRNNYDLQWVATTSVPILPVGKPVIDTC